MFFSFSFCFVRPLINLIFSLVSFMFMKKKRAAKSIPLVKERENFFDRQKSVDKEIEMIQFQLHNVQSKLIQLDKEEDKMLSKKQEIEQALKNMTESQIYKARVSQTAILKEQINSLREKLKSNN